MKHLFNIKANCKQLSVEICERIEL